MGEADGACSYISLLRWDEFSKDVAASLDHARRIYEKREEYDVTEKLLTG